MYTLCLVHLTPNSVITLVIFTHECEMFVGVQPSVVLLRHFFTLYRSSSIASDPGAAA